MRRWGATRISLDSSEGYQLPTKTHSGQISWYQPDPATHRGTHSHHSHAVAPLEGHSLVGVGSGEEGRLEGLVVLALLGIVVVLARLGEHALEAGR